MFFSSVPAPSRPQETGNWIQFWVIGLWFVHLTCIRVCSFPRITLEINSHYTDPKAETWNHRRHFIRKESEKTKQKKHWSVEAITRYEPFPVIQGLCVTTSWVPLTCVSVARPVDGSLWRAELYLWPGMFVSLQQLRLQALQSATSEEKAPVLSVTRCELMCEGCTDCKTRGIISVNQPYCLIFLSNL